MRIVKATKVKSKARICLAGPAGSGKTYSALAMARVFGKNIVVIDTENNSSAEYADEFGFDFDIAQMDEGDFAPSKYIEAITICEKRGFDVIICDSLSHAWFGPGGELELADKAAVDRYRGNSWAGWRDVTPEHNRLLHHIVHCKSHFIATMRSKVEHAMDRDESTGRTVIKKLGTKPIQKEGMDYEFNVYGDIDLQHNWTITKTRCSIIDQKTFNRPGRDVAEIIRAWLDKGEDPMIRREQIFFIDHGRLVGSTWESVQEYLGMSLPKPTTLEEWDSVEIFMSSRS